MASAVRRALTIAAAALLPAAALAASTAGATAATPKSFPAKFAAPYLELSSGSVGDLAADKSASGVSYYTLAFLIPRAAARRSGRTADTRSARSSRRSARCSPRAAT